jgi:hypothetical protein
MTDPTTEFFDRVAQIDNRAVEQKYEGTIRFDLRTDQRTEHWYLTLSDGMAGVSRENIDADAVIRLDKDLFDEVVTGEENVHAAWLRGALTLEGRVPLLTAFRDLVPSPPGAHDPREWAQSRRLAKTTSGTRRGEERS